MCAVGCAAAGCGHRVVGVDGDAGDAGDACRKPQSLELKCLQERFAKLFLQAFGADCVAEQRTAPRCTRNVASSATLAPSGGHDRGDHGQAKVSRSLQLDTEARFAQWLHTCMCGATLLQLAFKLGCFSNTWLLPKYLVARLCSKSKQAGPKAVVMQKQTGRDQRGSHEVVMPSSVEALQRRGRANKEKATCIDCNHKAMICKALPWPKIRTNETLRLKQVIWQFCY